MNIMGVDPGLSGGVVVMAPSGEIITYKRMPTRTIEEASGKKKKMIDIAQIGGIIARNEPVQVFIERVHAMPHQGVVSMFNFGMGYGMIVGLCLALEPLLHVNLVTPQAWQKFMYADVKLDHTIDPKKRALLRAHELWPSLAKEGVVHDGIIDALLIAEYGRRLGLLHS